MFIGPDARRWARLMALANPIGEWEIHFVKGAEQRGVLLLSQPDQNTRSDFGKNRRTGGLSFCADHVGVHESVVGT